LQRRKAAEIEEMRERAIALVGQVSDRDLLVAGIALYAGEGAKRDGCVKFANSDPAMVRLFLRWVRTFFDIDESRLLFRLYLHEGLDLDSAHGFWSELSGIPLHQFGGPYRAVPDPSIRQSKHPLGCASVTYSCTRTHRLIMGLIAALLESPP